MSFVRTRLQLDRMAQGEVLELRFAGEEAASNLPRNLTEQGYALLALDLATGVLKVRKP